MATRYSTGLSRLGPRRSARNSSQVRVPTARSGARLRAGPVCPRRPTGHPHRQTSAGACRPPAGSRGPARPSRGSRGRRRRARGRPARRGRARPAGRPPRRASTGWNRKPADTGSTGSFATACMTTSRPSWNWVARSVVHGSAGPGDRLLRRELGREVAEHGPVGPADHRDPVGADDRDVDEVPRRRPRPPPAPACRPCASSPLPAAGAVHDDVRRRTVPRRRRRRCRASPTTYSTPSRGLAVLPAQHPHRRAGVPQAGHDEAAERAGAAGDENGCGHGFLQCVTSGAVARVYRYDPCATERNVTDGRARPGWPSGSRSTGRACARWPTGCSARSARPTTPCRRPGCG